MYFQIKIIPIIVNLVSSIIVYDTRVFKGFDNYPIFSCAGTSQTSQIVFSDTFPEIPKIIISLEEIDTNINNSGFILEITDVQLTYFNITISCPYQSVYAIRFKWYAICGGGLQVINYISSGGIVNNTFPHSMSNPKYGFVSLTGFLYNGQIDFLLQVSKLTSSSISVEINQVAGKFPNLLKIGYQVVISQYEIINLGLQYAPQNFISQTIQQICSQWFIFNLQGVNFQNSDNFRLNLTYNNSADIISYEFGKWIGQYTGSYHSQLLFSYQNIVFSNIFNDILTFLCIYFSCALIKTKMKLISAININDLPEKKIVFIDLNLQYINEGIYNLILNKTLSYMQLEVAMKSFERKFIQSSIHSQENYNHLQSHVIKYKYEKIFNFMTFYLAFTSPNYEQQKLKIIITTGSIELVQVSLIYENQYYLIKKLYFKIAYKK